VKNFTRGSTPAVFNFLAFQLEDSRLVVGANSGTIHIFMVDSDINKDCKGDQPKNSISSFSFLGKLIPYFGKIGSY